MQKPGHCFSLIPGPESSQTLTPDSTVTDILGLQPGTSYQVAVSALRGREEGPPVVIVARTGQSLARSPGPLALCLQRPLDCCGSLDGVSPTTSTLSPSPPRPYSPAFPFTFACLSHGSLCIAFISATYPSEPATSPLHPLPPLPLSDPTLLSDFYPLPDVLMVP